MGISSLMGATRIAMSAYQTAIDTTARNIANADTEGYARRRANVGKLVSGTNKGVVGADDSGIDGSISRIKEGFVQNQLWYKQQNLGKAQTDELVFTQIERTFAEPSEAGLTAVMEQFWHAWNDLANDPESTTARTIVRDRASLLSRTFNQLSADLSNLQREIGNDVTARVDKVNKLLNDIKEINGHAGPAMNYDLMDQRDRAIDELSSLINITVYSDRNNAVSITTGGNVLVPLVTGDFINPLRVRNLQVDDQYSIEVSFTQGGQLDAVTGGELGSLLSVQNEYLPEYMNDLNTLAVDLATSVNAVHVNGYNPGNITGQNFFKDTITGALDFALEDDIVNDPTRIATAQNPDEPGDGSIAQQISDLQFTDIVRGQKTHEFYGSLVSKVGTRVQEAQFLRGNQEMLIQALQNQRDSVSGVSVDEEMTNLIRYEQAYQAATRMVAVVSDLIDSVLTLI